MKSVGIAKSEIIVQWCRKCRAEYRGISITCAGRCSSGGACELVGREEFELLPPSSRGPAPADGHGHEADPLERLELALEREKIKGRQAIALLSDFAALEARTREALDSLECPSYRVLDGCEAPEIVWLVVEPMVGTNGSVRAFRHQNTAKSYSGHGTRGLVTGPYSRHTLPSSGDVELARQVLRENFEARPREDIGPFRDAHNVPSIAYELGRRDADHANEHRRCELVEDYAAMRAGLSALIAQAPTPSSPHEEEMIGGFVDALADLLAGKKIESTGEARKHAKASQEKPRND